MVVYLPGFQSVFDTHPLPASELGVCLLAGTVSFCGLEGLKWVRRLRAGPATR